MARRVFVGYVAVVLALGLSAVEGASGAEWAEDGTVQETAAKEDQAAGPSRREQQSRALLQLKGERDAAVGRYGKEDARVQLWESGIASLQSELAAMQQAQVNEQAMDGQGMLPGLSLNYARIVEAVREEAVSSGMQVAGGTKNGESVVPAESDESAADRAALKAMREAVVSFDGEKVPMVQFFDALREQSGCNFTINWAAFQSAGLEKTTPVTVHMNKVVLEKALKVGLPEIGNNANLSYVVEDGFITVSTKDELSSNAHQLVRMYDVQDLIAAPAGLGYPAEWLAQMRNERANKLMDVLKATVSPDSWRDAGGTIGSMREIDGVLIINQTTDNHRAVKAMLAEFRAIHARRN